MKKNKLHINLNRIFSNGAFAFIFLLGIEAFTFKIPYYIVMGTFLVLTSLLFFPWLNKIGNMISVKNKWFIGIVNLFIAAYLINPHEKNYYKCILPIVLMIIIWVITIFHSKQKNKN